MCTPHMPSFGFENLGEISLRSFLFVPTGLVEVVIKGQNTRRLQGIWVI